MYNAFQLALKYAAYYVTAHNGRGHGMHSPFVYEFIRNVLMDKKAYDAYQRPEAYRKELLRNHTELNIKDFGAGSASGKTTRRKVSAIAKSSVKHKRYAQLLYRMTSYYEYRQILELGTSLGVTSSYLAQGKAVEECVTMEGAESIADLAEKELVKYEKLKLVRGEFEKTDIVTNRNNLETVLYNMPRVDLAFIDGNHRLEPTLRYFETILPKTHTGSCIVFDDIHWSKDMEKAWGIIKADKRITLSIDLFFIGLVFFRQEFREKQHFVIRF